MTDEHGVITPRIQPTPGLIGNWNVTKLVAALEPEARQMHDLERHSTHPTGLLPAGTGSSRSG
jgi:hypothetical protein